MNTIDFPDLLTFMELMEQLKTTPRTGWVEMGIPQPESIADHIFRTCIMALILTPKTLDRNKVIKMALVHDIGESIIGDISTTDTTITKEQKHERELAAINHISSLVSNDEIVELFNEFELQQTAESKFVKNLETLEMMFQVQHYATRHPEIDLTEFWDWANDKDFGETTSIYQQLQKLQKVTN